MRRLFRAAAFALAVSSTGDAVAGSLLQPGGTVGLPTGAPLPEGIYFINTSSYGERTSTPSGFGVNLTQLVWSTPFSFYDTRVQVLVLHPTKYVTKTASDVFYLDSPLYSGQLAHAFGNGFNASYLGGIRVPMPSGPAYHVASYEQRGAVTYNANGLNLTANAINGLFSRSQFLYPDYFNLDLTATKKFDKLEIGPVAFGSTDLNRPTGAYRLQRQIAVGGLVGYKFEKFALQAYLTRDVFQRNYTGYDTRGFLRLILPLYVAPTAPPEPLRARF